MVDNLVIGPFRGHSVSNDEVFVDDVIGLYLAFVPQYTLEES